MPMPHDPTPTDKRPCCPACRSLDIVRRVRLQVMACEQCGWIGPRTALDEREPEHSGGPRAGLAGVLDAMDPDELTGGGG